DLQRAQIGVKVEMILGKEDEIGQVQGHLHVALWAEGQQRQIRRLADDAGAETDLDHDDERDEEEHQQPEQRRQDHRPTAAEAGQRQPVAEPAPWSPRRRPQRRRRRCRVHEVSTEPALPLQLAQTGSSQLMASGSPRSALALVTRNRLPLSSMTWKTLMSPR